MKRFLIRLLAMIVLAPVFLIVVGMFFFIFGGIFNFIFQAIFFLLFGWIAGIFRLLGGLRHEPVAVGIGLVALVMLPIALHLFVRNLRGVTTSWKFRQSIGVCGVFCSLMIATIGMIAMIHEVYWLAHPKEPMTISSIDRDKSSQYNLNQMGLGVLSMSKHPQHFLPSGGTLLKDGRPGHSWMTQLLPYVESTSYYYDPDKPWDDPVNAKLFKEKIPYSYRTWKPRLHSGYKDANGYRLTDYAANEHVMPFGRSLRLRDITDTSNTILCGEAAENLKPWGSPFNGRDPALGINRSPHGFGYDKTYTTVNFAMCDGSVQSFSVTTDPEILKVLATPNGGESVVP